MDAFLVCDDGAIMMLFGKNTFLRSKSIHACWTIKNKMITFRIYYG